MGVEGNDRRPDAETIGGLADQGQNLPMAEVHPVEHTYGRRDRHRGRQLISPIVQQLHRRLQRG